MKIYLKDVVINTLCKILLPFYSLFIAVLSVYYLLNSKFIAAFLTLYLLPLATWRVIHFFYPLKEGTSYIAGEIFSPWLSSYRIQEIYIKFPFLEKIIMLVPFLFNAWLRLWGSKIGRRVLFAPNTTIIDRAGLIIDDNVYIGDQCYFSCHFVLEKDQKFLCTYKKIRIGGHSFIGAFSRFAPGAKVKEGSRVRAFSFFRMNSEVAETFVLEKINS